MIVWRRAGETDFRMRMYNYSSGPLVGGTFELYWDDANGVRQKVEGTSEWANTRMEPYLPDVPFEQQGMPVIFKKPPGFTAKSFTLVYRGTINATPTAPADPVEIGGTGQGLAVAAVRFTIPLAFYKALTVTFSGVTATADVDYPVNASFPLSEWIPWEDPPRVPPPIEQPAQLGRFNAVYPAFQATYTETDPGGDTQTSTSPVRVYVVAPFLAVADGRPQGNWYSVGFNSSPLPWPPPVFEGADGIRVPNYPYQPWGYGASGGTAVIVYQ